MPGPTTFHLVRHASHGLLPHTLAGRMPGVALSEAGREEALLLAARFGAEAVAAIVSSPLQRARETAEPIAERLGLELATDAGFEEIDFGVWTGQRFDELAPDTAWQAWNRLRSLAGCPGGETMAQAQARALLALGRLRAAYPDGSVVVVSHADVLKAVLAAALGLPLDHMQRLTLEPASCSTLVVFDADVRVDRVNWTVATCRGIQADLEVRPDVYS